MDMKSLIALATGLTAALLPLTALPAYAADRVDLSRPATLERGEDLRVAHIEGDTIVDGEVRIDLDTRRLLLLGTSGDDYVVQTWRQRSGRAKVKRVTADGDVTVLLRGRKAWGAVVSADGEHVVTNDHRRRGTITVHDASDGSQVASRRFRGYPFVVDAADGTVLISSWSRGRTITWDTDTNRRRRLVDHVVYTADLQTDRIAYFTKDPYSGGCSVVAPLSDPDTRLWRSCRQKVASFSPDGSLLTSMYILADGLGPNVVQLREVDGSRLATYEARWFGRIRWEDSDTLLLDANGKRRMATARCDGTDCERASDLSRSSA